ncbi:MAG: transporter [Nitrospirae bacterium]|nr:transporter [Nitrospirota bacterium]NTW64885.1 transporter [Nitrospirota bacterium]
MREYAAAIAMVLIPAAAWAMHPLFTDDTGTQGPGAVLVESNVNYLKDNEFRSTVVPLAVTAGIGEAIDIGVEVPYLWLRPSAVTGQPQSGFSDVVFRCKHRFYEQEKKSGGHEQFEQSLAYQLFYAQPSGEEEKGLGAGTSRWGARMISTTEWESVEINANLGYESSGRALRRGNFTFDHAVLLSVAAEYERSKPWEPVVELAVIRVKEPDTLTRIVTALIGLIYEPSEKFYVDAGVRVGLNDTSEDYALLAGFGYKF